MTICNCRLWNVPAE